MCLSRATLLVGSLIVGLLANKVSAQHYPEFEPAGLQQGRSIWLSTCEGCHGYGIAGAPNPQKPSDWRARLAQEQQTLHQHAIEGFFGPSGTMMPPRGGNDNLSDEEVKLAVDYMVALAKFYDNTDQP